MPLARRFSTALSVRAVLTVGIVLGLSRGSYGGEARLKNGVLLDGKLVPIQGLTKGVIKQTEGPVTNYPILMIHTGLKRYFVPARQVDELNQAADLSRYETFKIPQRKTGRKLMVGSLGSLRDVTEFDDFGRRRVTISTSRGPVHIVEGVTEISPKYLTVNGLTHMWEHGIATTSVPPEILDAMIRKVTNQKDPDERMAIARFYLQAGLYRQSSAELESIVKDFPELKQRVKEIGLELRELQAKQLLVELRRRRAAGQHRLAYAAAKLFPAERMSATVLREVRELTASHERSRERIERVLALLGELQAQLKDPQQISQAAMLRSQISSRLDYESLSRLDAFMNLADDDSLPAGEKLALAYSGWVLGSAKAITDFEASLRLFKARYLLVEYLRCCDSQKHIRLLERLSQIEGIGPNRIVQMIPNLPPTIETPGLVAGKARAIEVTGKDSKLPVAYSVLLPQEYSPHHRYPMIVALRPAERATDQVLLWWGGTAGKPGQSQRRGYIVIAPEYADSKQRKYDYSAVAHTIVIQSIRDARKRFNVDSDRIFLAGHGMGGNAAFDIGMSHPDLFAGVIPITGISDKYCKWYWKNASRLPWYIVAGELDRDSLAQNARELNRMMRYGYDIIYVEYLGRGYESYYAEIHKLFDWMDLQRRTKYVKQIEAKVLRPTDNRLFWIRAEGLPRNVSQATVLTGGDRKGRISPMPLNAKVTPGNSIYITSGADRYTIWLSPEFIDFDRRVMVRYRGRQRFNDFLQPEIETILEDLRIRGDRQKLYWVKLQID